MRRTLRAVRPARSILRQRTTRPASPPTPDRIAQIESLDALGRGVTHLEGKTTFVEGALTGEMVWFETLQRKPSFDRGRITRVERASPARVTPRCPHFGVCGGCALQHIDPATQVAAKQRVLEDALAHIGKVQPESVFAPIVGPAWGYRHRARLSVRRVEKKGGVLVGFHERGSSYVAVMDSCEVLPAAVSALIVPLRELIGRLSIAERLPQVEVAVGGEVTVLVLRVLLALNEHDEAQIRAFADRHRVQIWLQTAGPESAQPFHPLDAPPLDYLIDDFGVRIGFLPTDFTQVNHAVNTVLVRRALGLLAPRPGEGVLDLFCGLGNFTLPIARSGALVHGVEGNAGLIRRATANAARNGVTAQFSVANLFDPAQIPDLSRADKLLIDPPREGAVEVVKALPEAGAPHRIVYVSCDPATLARDAGLLCTVKGYRLVGAGIANMFPHTAHVESIALFERT